MRCAATRVKPNHSSAASILKHKLRTNVFSNNIRIFVFSCNLSWQIIAIHQPEVSDG